MIDASQADAGAVPVYPMPRAARCPFDPPETLRAMQAERSIARVRLWDGSTPWIVTRYREQRALLADPRISSNARHPNFPHSSEVFKERRKRAQPFIAMDDPEHARQRRMVTAPFSIKRVEALRPAIQKIVDGLIDDVLAGARPVDLVQALALPVPSLVICELLGVPYADHDFFQKLSSFLLHPDTKPEQGLDGQQRMIEYLDDLVGRKLVEPGDDLLSRLAEERVKTGELTRHDAAVMGHLLLAAGHETTANMIALGTLALLQHPDQLALLRETDDPRLIANAVEELLRYLNIVHTGRRRVALEEIEIGGVTIRAGDGVIMPTDIANRDPSAFSEPDQLDIARDARHHVAFGFGVHQCLGQPLARVELQVVYGTLYRRIPTLELAKPLDEIPFKQDGLVYGVYELPVTW